MEPSSVGVASKKILLATGILVALHLSLLLASLPDYIADNDLGFHISLGRQYGEHGVYFWDHLNWAPTGRPNLQGPLLHFSIGVLGRLLGGHGDDYVLAFSLLAILQWMVAVFTAFWFARKYGGDWAGLFAVALLTGSAWSAGPFFVGVPSGWIFILTPWAIHFFLEKRYVPATVFTVMVMYVHLGGAPVAPLGVFLAAAWARDWKGLLKVGTACAVLASPYLVHFALHLEWYNGIRGHVAGDIALLTYLLALPGLIYLLFNPRRYHFLMIWVVAPIAWFFQDNLRFFLQSTVAASAIAGVGLAAVLPRISRAGIRVTIGAAVVLLATAFPLSIPSLPIEAAWALGYGFPRELDWTEARALAQIVEKSGTGDRIVHSYYDSLSGAMSVYHPGKQEFGHWGEVRPPVNPARELSAGEKLYVMPVPPGDELLRSFKDEGLIRILGGSPRTSLLLLGRRGSFDELAPRLALIIRAETAWVAEHGVNNRMPPLSDLLHPERVEAFREKTTRQRNRIGRIEVCVLILAYAQEGRDSEFAADLRESERAWGVVANFVGDETAIDYLDDARFGRFRHNLSAWGDGVVDWVEGRISRSEIDGLTDRMFDDFFG